ncbi:MAG: hypothetical protein ABIH69_05405 [bacterium]
MSNHSRVLFPLGTWCYNSPEINHEGRSLDIGLLAESLIYYDQIFLNVETPKQFSELISWFKKENAYPELLTLFNENILNIYEYSFVSAAIKDTKAGSYVFFNMQDQTQEKPNTFEQRYLYDSSLSHVLTHSRERAKLFKALNNKVTEVKASQFGAAIDNARLDSQSSTKTTLAIQALVDEIYPILRLGPPPNITTTIEHSGSKYGINYNINLSLLSSKLGKEFKFP